MGVYISFSKQQYGTGRYQMQANKINLRVQNEKMISLISIKKLEEKILPFVSTACLNTQPPNTLSPQCIPKPETLLSQL